MIYLCNYDCRIATPLPKLLPFYPKLPIVLPTKVTCPFILGSHIRPPKTEAQVRGGREGIIVNYGEYTYRKKFNYKKLF